MDEELRKAVWPIFLAEAGEYLELLNAEVLQLAQEASKWPPDLIEKILRQAHSLKGSAGSLGLDGIERLSHALETAMGRGVKAQRFEPAEVATLVLGLELVGDLLAAVERDGEEPTEKVTEVVAALTGKPAPTTNPVEAPTPAAEQPEAPVALIPSEVEGPAESSSSRASLDSAQDELDSDDFVSAALREVTALEEALGKIRSPFTANRAAEGRSAAECAARVEALATPANASAVVALARQLREGFELVGDTPPPPTLSVTLAGALVDLQDALALLAPALPAPEVRELPISSVSLFREMPSGVRPEPESTTGVKVEVSAKAADRSLRVSEKTLDSLSLQIENITLVVGREERRTRDLRSLGLRALEILKRWEQGASPGAAAPAPGEDGKSQLRLLGKELSRMARDSSLELEHLRLVSTVIRDDLRDLRMVPASTMGEQLRRTVREVAGRLKKDVELKLVGGEVRLDRRIMDELKDPLQHLVRNAVDHGMESRPGRTAAGKPSMGTLELKIEQRGNRVAVIVSDDGVGLSLEKIRATAVRRGLLSQSAAAQLDDSDSAMLIFRPGFSTAEQVTELSGRGVGLDVVHEAVTRLQGLVSVDFTPGRGTRFTLDLPLTLAAAQALVVEVGSDQVAVPIEAVQRVLRLQRKQIGTVAGRTSIEHESGQIPFVPLSQAIGAAHGNVKDKGVQLALVLTGGSRTVAFGIDDIVRMEDVVVQSLGRALSRSAHLTGAAVLEGGRVVGVLNVPELLRAAKPGGRSEAAARIRILVTDDSLTTRTAMKAVLEIAGYTVLACRDGLEAFNTLKANPCRLVVSDVQMPNLDGLGLARRIRADPELSSIPIILVTSLDSPEDRAAGLAAGADGYLVKREVERGKLLELVRQLLPS